MRHKSIFLTSTLCVAALCGCQHAPPFSSLEPAEAYLDFTKKACDLVESGLPDITRVAEIVAQRHLNGGLIGFPWNYQGLQQELMGRSGGMVHIGFERPWKANRTDHERTNDVAIIGWDRAPAERDLQLVKEAQARGCYVIGFGPRKMPSLSEHAKLCDAWFDTGFAAEDGVVRFDDGSSGGHGNCLMNTLCGWALTAEVVSALTRHGRMPTMWKSYSYEDGRAWGDRYLGKKQFHDEFRVPPIGRGKLAKDYLVQIRDLLQRFEQTQLPAVNQTADQIVAEVRRGRKTVVATMGHMPWTFAGKYEDAVWATALELNHGDSSSLGNYVTNTPDRALLLRVGYSGQHRDETALYERKQNREMLITASDNPRAEWRLPTNLVTKIEMGWAFGDACVTIPGYSIKVFPPSGVMQLVAYECVNVAVLEKLAANEKAVPSSEK